MSRLENWFYIWALLAWGGTCAFLGYCHGVRKATGRYQNLLQPKEEDAPVWAAPHRREVALRRVKFKRGNAYRS